MKLFRRRSVKRIKSEMNRIKTEMDKLSSDLDSVCKSKGSKYLNNILWSDYNGILKGLEWVLKERDSL